MGRRGGLFSENSTHIPIVALTSPKRLGWHAKRLKTSLEEGPWDPRLEREKTDAVLRVVLNQLGVAVVLAGRASGSDSLRRADDEENAISSSLATYLYTDNIETLPPTLREDNWDLGLLAHCICKDPNTQDAWQATADETEGEDLDSARIQLRSLAAMSFDPDLFPAEDSVDPETVLEDRESVSSQIWSLAATLFDTVFLPHKYPLPRSPLPRDEELADHLGQYTTKEFLEQYATKELLNTLEEEFADDPNVDVKTSADVHGIDVPDGEESGREDIDTDEPHPEEFIEALREHSDDEPGSLYPYSALAVALRDKINGERMDDDEFYSWTPEREFQESLGRLETAIAYDTADPAPVEPETNVKEASYVKAKKGALDVGDNLSGGKFFFRERTFARKQYWDRWRETDDADEGNHHHDRDRDSDRGNEDDDGDNGDNSGHTVSGNRGRAPLARVREWAGKTWVRLRFLWAWIASQFLRWVTGYGEKPQYVVVWSLGIVGIFWAIFWRWFGELEGGMAALQLSLGAFVTLVPSSALDIKPQGISDRAILLAEIEGFFGMFLVALFVATLARSIQR